MAIPRIEAFSLNGGPGDGKLIVAFFGASNSIRIEGELFDPDYVNFRVSCDGVLLGNERVTLRGTDEILGTFDARGILWPWQKADIEVQVYNDGYKSDHEFEVHLRLFDIAYHQNETSGPPQAPGSPAVTTCTPRISGVTANADDPDPSRRGKILFNADGSTRRNTMHVVRSCQDAAALLLLQGGPNETYSNIVIVTSTATSMDATFDAKTTTSSITNVSLTVTVQNPRSSGFWRLVTPADTIS